MSEAVLSKIRSGNQHEVLRSFFNHSGMCMAQLDSSMRVIEANTDFSCQFGCLPAELSVHCLRHSYISQLVEDGADPVFVQHQAGHSFASTTAVYTTVGADHVNRAMRAALERAFRDDQEGS